MPDADGRVSLAANSIVEVERLGRSRAVGRAQRHAKILEHLRQHGRVDVAHLAGQFGVTDMTVRRDLAVLDREGKVFRVHGGAMTRRPAPYEARAGEQAAAKQAIGRHAAELVPPRQTVALDIGTTCHAVAEHLCARDDLTVICYSLHIAMLFRGSGSRVVVLGGELTDELTLVNGGVVDIAARLHVDSYIAGCAGISPDTGITYFNPAEIEVRRALVAAADEVTIVADRRKLSKRAPFALGPIAIASRLITDAAGAEAAALRDHLHVRSVP